MTGEIPRRQFLRYGATALTVSSIAATTTAQDGGVDSWLGFGHNAANSGHNPSATVSGYDASQRWTLTASDPATSGITVFDRTVYFTDTVGRVYRVTDDGAIEIFELGTGQTESATRPMQTSTPLLDSERLYVGGLSEQVIALDRRTGEEQWTVGVDSPIRSSPVEANGTLYVADTAGTVFALDTMNGDSAWTYRTGTKIHNSPALVGDDLYVATRPGDVHRVGISSGTGQEVASFDEEIDASPVADDTTVYIATRGGSIAAIEDGVSWEMAIGESVTATPAVTDDALYIGGAQGTLAAFDPADSGQRWSVSLDGGVRGGIAAGEETVVVGTESGSVYGIHTTTAETRWKYDIGTAVTAPPSLVDGIIYVGGANSQVFALELDSGFFERFVGAVTSGDVGGAYTAIDSTVPRSIQGLGGLGIGGAVAYSVARRFRDRDTDDTSPAEPPKTGTQSSEATPTLASVPSPSLSGDPTQISETPQHSGAATQLSGASYEDFEQLDRIGSGGNADVYRARYRDDDSIVALKLPRIADDETLDTSAFSEFLDEAEIWNSIDDHERIVSVYAWGQQPMPWIAVEYMDAGTLGSQELAYGDTFAELEGFCEALHHAHRQGVTHTDIKPENILYREISGQRVGKLTDWGLANELLDHSMSVGGFTPDYSAPEQLRPEEYGGTDERTDIYQLGVVAYELFTDELPYGGDSEGAGMMAVLNSEPTPPSDRTPQLNSDLDDVLLKAISKEKEHRYETALHFRDDLRRVYHENRSN